MEFLFYFMFQARFNTLFLFDYLFKRYTPSCWNLIIYIQSLRHFLSFLGLLPGRGSPDDILCVQQPVIKKILLMDKLVSNWATSVTKEQEWWMIYIYPWNWNIPHDRIWEENYYLRCHSYWCTFLLVRHSTRNISKW